MKILVTGGSTGIGKFLIENLKSRGHELCSLARTSQQNFSFECDVSNWESMLACSKEISKRWKSLDALICCAGTQLPIGPAMNIDPLAWRNNLAVNLDGTFFTIRAMYSLLLKAPSRAKIICFSGGGSTMPRPNFAAYGVAKTGVVRLVETLAAEWVDKPLDINAVAPGAIYTKMTEEVLEHGSELAGQKEFEVASNLTRSCDAKLANLLGLVEMLLSKESDGITGKLISAPWDSWQNLPKLKGELMNSDIYTLRRIVPEDRGKNFNI